MCEQSNDKIENVTEHEDEYSKAIGEAGIWQIFVFLITALPMKLVLSSVHFGIIFMAPKSTYRCLERENATGELLNMTCYNDCKQYEYYSDFDNNIIKQWNLICDRAWISDFGQIVCMFGVVIGCFVFGFTSDRYGRRITLIIAGIMEACTTFTTPLCSNLGWFLFVRFLLGSATGGTNTTAFVLLMEIFGQKKRDLIGTVYMLPLSLGFILVSTFSFYFRDWRRMSLIMALPTLTYLSYFFCLPESPKWLISVGKLEEACTVMTSAAKWNKLPTENMMSVVKSISEKSKASRKSERKPTFVDLVKLPSLRIRNLCSCLIWFIIGVTFYGIVQYFGQTTSNVFWSFGAAGLILFFGFSLGGYLSNIFGRRIALIAFFIIHGIGSAVSALPEEWFYTRMIAATIGFGCACAIRPLLYVYTSELFPTVARSMGVAASSTTNRLGNTLAPLVGGLRILGHWIPAAGFGLLPVIAVIACLFLPETKGKKLEDHLEEP